MIFIDEFAVQGNMNW